MNDPPKCEAFQGACGNVAHMKVCADNKVAHRVKGFKKKICKECFNKYIQKRHLEVLKHRKLGVQCEQD